VKGIIFPPFANDPKQLLSTWQKLFGMGIETIFPGHGPRFNVEKAKKAFNKRRAD
jgi:hydroxyacylglutathione hydrolase